ncbi:hypothetical protein B566_EDAN005070 [Ephemera danica]|nr:hypothetical protein B566_EDAN005070 [Ephemera danica]
MANCSLFIFSYHQTHYEQHGDITGTATIDGKTYPIHLNSMRDHSYGHKREWKNFHRLELGYVYTPDGQLHPLQSCDLKLYEHGENGTPPLDYGFNFRAGGCKYSVQVRVEHSPEFYIGEEWEARVVERMARYTVNGIKGWGIAEWEYRHVEGRPLPPPATSS